MNKINTAFHFWNASGRYSENVECDTKEVLDHKYKILNCNSKIS